MPARIAKYFLVPLATAVVLSGLLVLESRAQVDVNAIQEQIEALYNAGRHAEASALAERFVPLVVQIYGQGGREHADSLNKLGWAYAGEGRSAEAIRMFEQSLPMAERAFGPAHWIIGMISNNLASEYEEIGKAAEAEALWRRGIAVYERDTRDNAGLLASSLGNLGRMYISQGRLRDAEPLFERSLQLAEKLRKEPEILSLALNNLGELREKQGRPAEAEQLLRRSLAVREKAYGASHTMTARGLTNLATFYDTQSRISDSYPLLLRSLDIQLNTLGMRHPEVTRVLDRLAANNHLYADTDKKGVELVEKLLKEQLAYFEKQGPNSPQLDGVLEGLATLYGQSGRHKEQEPLVQRRLAYAQKAFGRESLQVGELLGATASIHAAQGRHKDALDFGRRGLAIRERYHGPNGSQTIHSHGNLAAYHRALKDWRSAAAELRTVVTYLAKRERGAELSRSSSMLQQGLWIDQSYTHALIQVLHRLGASDAAIIDESFQTAQLALLSDAGASLARMSARVAAGDDALAGLVRERQDLVMQRTATDKQLLELALKDVGKAAPKVRETLNRSLSELDAKLNKIDARIRAEYPSYASVSDPEPLTVKAAQAVLGAQEALVVFLDAPVTKNVEHESYVWTITKTDVRWTRLASTPAVLADKVRTLRCGLDRDGEWVVEKDRWVGRNKPCQELRPAGLAVDEQLPFDLARSHDLYKELLGPSESVLKNADGSWKRLIVVHSASLAALPFHVLATEAPETAQGADYAAAKWLATRQAISVLPSVVSLKALREFAHTSKATGAFVGFGNPLIHGADGSDKRAWQRQSCNAKSGGQVKVVSRRVDRTKTQFFRGELADVEAIRAQSPLPETAGELCEVAASLNAGDDAVYLGAKATERTIKTLSANGTLARARVLHFATHGLLATESKAVAGAADEPALLLTPPRKASEEDDGLLTASEVAQLKLDADWVVLSACNTAGGGSTLEAEPLSGLARAFFYAGTRAILVSHWYVDSEAAVALVTKTFGALEAKPDIGRAEALRQSMLTLIGKGGGKAHPAQWAPFVVVGEGAR